MKYIILCFVSIILLSTSVSAQCPLPIPPLDAGGNVSFIDTKTPAQSACSGIYYGFDIAGSIFYQLTLNVKAKVIITTCGSTVSGTGLVLVDANYNGLAYDSGSSCAGHGAMTVNLPPGTYNIGALSNPGVSGNIVMQINATPYTDVPALGATIDNPIDVGNLVTGSVFQDLQSNAPSSNFGNEIGGVSDDIYYKFTLLRDEEVNISANGGQSGLSTRFYLLDAGGNLLANQYDVGTGSWTTPPVNIIDKVLPAGTYYAVTESKDLDYGVLGTRISLLSSYSHTVTPVPDMISSITIDKFSQSGVLTADAADALNYTGKIEEVQYFDGLGRPLQTVERQSSPSAKDVIQAYSYDAYGREDKKYLPYVNTGASYGTYRNNAQTAVFSYYNPGGGTVEGKQTNGIVRTLYPYAQTGFEASPLNRIVEQGATGKTWQLGSGAADAGSSNHTQRVVYTTNDLVSFTPTDITNNNGSRRVLLYTAEINTNGSRTLSRKGDTARYQPGQLNVTIKRNENWQPTDHCLGTMEEYTDKEGHLVLKRTYNLNKAKSLAEQLSTYYVYDDLGNLAFVLPPSTNADSSTPTQSTLDLRAYQYRYDGRNRLTQKRIPGKGWDYMIYNKLDQVVAIQDSVQRAKTTQEWTITKYDAMGRMVLTAIYQHGSSGSNLQAAMQAVADTTSKQWEDRDSTTATGYTAQTWPKTWNTTLSINFYDSYKGIPGFPAPYNQTGNTAYSTQTTGLVTASKVLVLNTTGDYLWSVPYYNKEGKVIRAFSQHYVGGAPSLSPYNYDDITTVYTFLKQPKTVTRKHYVISSALKTSATLFLTATDSSTYDHMGRLRAMYQQIKDKSATAQKKIVLSLNTYNEIGQLVQKSLHSFDNGSNYMQKVNYRYNARGWLTNINNPSLQSDSGLTNSDTNDRFGMELKYDDATTATPQYNGNIATAKTYIPKMASATAANIPLTYDYTYDKINRLSSAVSTSSTPKDGLYNENLQYNTMGDITKLNRYENTATGRQAIDSLNYTYTGTKLTRVVDSAMYTGSAGFKASTASTQYLYDGNGNQTKDNNKTTSTAWNILNLPQLVTFTNGNTIAYVYDASGRKLRKVTVMGTVTTNTEYDNGIEYDNYVDNTSNITFIQTEEGRARKGATKYVYEYDLKDHLGNTRVTVSPDPNDATEKTPKILQEDNYYAFGYTIQSTEGITNPKNEYLYNDKELQEETGLYDYGARLYDPVIARWTSVDPLAEFYKEWSTYNYVQNNPIRMIDPNGMGHFDVNGNWIEDLSDNNTYSYLGQVTQNGQTFTWMGNGTGWIAENQLSNSQLERMYYSYTNLGQDPFQGAYGNQIRSWAESWGGFQSGYNTNAKTLNIAEKTTIGATYLLAGEVGAGEVAGNFLINLARNPEIESSAISIVTPKIANQLAKRGWTTNLINEVVNNAAKIGTTINRATGNVATAYFDSAGAYIVKDNVTNEIIQISNRLDPNWIIDPAIKIPR